MSAKKPTPPPPALYGDERHASLGEHRGYALFARPALGTKVWILVAPKGGWKEGDLSVHTEAGVVDSPAWKFWEADVPEAIARAKDWIDKREDNVEVVQKMLAHLDERDL